MRGYASHAVVIGVLLLMAAQSARQKAERRPPIAIGPGADVWFYTATPIALSPLPPGMRHGLQTAVAEALATGMKRPDEAARWRALAPSAEVMLEPLGRSGLEEAMVRGPWASCSGDGNCTLLIFRWNGTRWLPVLRHAIGDGFAIQPQTSHGLHDVVVSMHGSATESEDWLYRYNGHTYVRDGCWDVTWISPTAKEPDFAPCD